MPRKHVGRRRNRTAASLPKLRSADQLYPPQFFAGRRKDLTALLHYHHRVFDADAAETLQVDAGLDGDRHAGFEAGLVALAEARGFVDLQAQAVAGGVYKGAVQAI